MTKSKCRQLRRAPENRRKTLQNGIAQRGSRSRNRLVIPSLDRHISIASEQKRFRASTATCCFFQSVATCSRNSTFTLQFAVPLRCSTSYSTSSWTHRTSVRRKFSSLCRYFSKSSRIDAGRLQFLYLQGNSQTPSLTNAVSPKYARLHRLPVDLHF